MKLRIYLVCLIGLLLVSQCSSRGRMGNIFGAMRSLKKLKSLKLAVPKKYVQSVTSFEKKLVENTKKAAGKMKEMEEKIEKKVKEDMKNIPSISETLKRQVYQLKDLLSFKKKVKESVAPISSAKELADIFNHYHENHLANGKSITKTSEDGKTETHTIAVPVYQPKNTPNKPVTVHPTEDGPIVVDPHPDTHLLPVVVVKKSPDFTKNDANPEPVKIIEQKKLDNTKIDNHLEMMAKFAHPGIRNKFLSAYFGYLHLFKPKAECQPMAEELSEMFPMLMRVYAAETRDLHPSQKGSTLSQKSIKAFSDLNNLIEKFNLDSRYSDCITEQRNSLKLVILKYLFFQDSFLKEVDSEKGAHIWSDLHSSLAAFEKDAFTQAGQRLAVATELASKIGVEMDDQSLHDVNLTYCLKLFLAEKSKSLSQGEINQDLKNIGNKIKKACLQSMIV